MRLALAQINSVVGDVEGNTARVVDWLERGQIRKGDRVSGVGSWSYTEFKGRPGDNSNTQYALLGLNAAAEAGVPIKPAIWDEAPDNLSYRFQKGDQAATSAVFTAAARVVEIELVNNRVVPAPIEPRAAIGSALRAVAMFVPLRRSCRTGASRARSGRPAALT